MEYYPEKALTTAKKRRTHRKMGLACFCYFAVRPQLLVGMIRHGWAVASRRLVPGAKRNGATVGDQSDSADN